MKKVLFFLTTLTLLSLAWGGAVKAQTLTVFNDATDVGEFVPFYGFYADYTQHNQLIYPAAELAAMNGMSITQMVFYISTWGEDPYYGDGDPGYWYVSLRETDATTLDELDYTPLTQVYEGLMNFDSEHTTMTITFDDAYTYHGGNLLIDFNHTTTASYRHIFFSGVTATGASFCYSEQRDFLPKVTFTYEAGCVKPANINVTALTSSSISVGWPAGNATSWNVYLNGTLTDDSPVSSNSYTFDNLTEYEVNYTIGVSAVCGSEVSDVTTTTVLLCIPAPSSVDYSGITNVTFGGVNDNFTMSSDPAPYYYDHSSQIGGASPGETVNMSIVYATNYPYYTWVWVDWNQDHTFSDEECVYTSIETISSGPLGLSFDVPDTIASGYYHMRIQGADNAEKKDPCYTGTYSYLVDYTLHIGEASVCLAPAGLTATNVTHEGATLTWSNPNEGGSYIIKRVDGNVETVIEDNHTTTSYPITGLDPQTDYTYRVYIKCNASDISDSAEVSFSTTAPATAVGDYWSDDFEGTSCEWELINGNQTNAWVWGTATNNGGTHSLYISKDGGSTNTYSGASTKVFAAKLLNFTDSKYTFEYDWNCYGEKNWDFLRVALVPASETLTAGEDYSTIESSGSNSLPTGWIALDGGGQLNESTSWQNKSVAINVAAGNYYLVLAWRNDVYAYDPPAAVDNVSITKIACEYLVEGVQVINSTVTTSTANVLWDASEATAWQVQTKAGDGEWTTLASSDVDFSLSGVKEIAYLRNLTPGTEYQVRVRANCGNEQYGTWSEVVGFTTECAPRAVTNDNKFTANFDDMTGSTYPSENNLPICWNYINTCSYATYSLYPYVYWSINESNSGTNHLRFFSLASANYTYYNPKPQYAILPPMQDVSNLRIKFYARAYNIGTDYDATFKVGVLTNPNDASTFTEIATYTPATTTYELYTIPFNTYSGNGNYIAIMIDAAEVPASGDFHRMLFVDDITVEPIPECVVPTNLRTVSVAHDGATVKWAANLEESWNLKYHAQGENQWIEVNGLQDSTYTFTELNAETEYEWQVQAACGANLTSDWSSLGTFTTEAEPQVTCHEWQLVTKASDLQDGDQIIIAAAGNYNVAMSTTQKDNNRDVATIIKDGNKLTLPVGDDVQVLTANYLATNDAWTLYTGEGYLYAASSSSNLLRTEEEIDEYGNAYWTITFSNGVASIVANGNNSRKIMKYNNNSRIISCYASGQSPLAIYRLIDNRRLATKDTTVAHALPFIFTMAGQPDTIITSYGEFNLSYVIEADPVNCDSVLNVHLTVNEPMFTVTLEAGAGTIALPTPLTGNSTHPVDLANLVPELDNNCTEWTFAGWSSAAVAETNDAPDFVTTISPTSDTTLYAVYVKSEGGSGDAIWQKANTIAIGDQMVLVYETGKYELSGISTTSTKYGERVSYSVAPTGVYPLTVVAGTAAASYSLKTSDDNYLTWTSGNSLNKASSVTDNSSWSISFDNDGNADIANISQDTRKIRYNTGSPRFACYEGGQSAVQLYKLSNPVVNTYNSNPVCDVNYNITLVQPADGSISSDPAQTASAGAVVTLTATPNAGYTFGSWEVRNVDNGGTVEVTNDQFIMPAANVEVHASFTAIEYTVTATANPAAGGTITGTGTYSYEGAASLTASANNGYEFVNWTNEQGAVVCTTATYNFIVTRDSALTANFALKEYTITYMDGNTELDVDTFAFGADVTAIADPEKECKEFAGWYETLPATMPANNIVLYAQWNDLYYNITASADPVNGGSVTFNPEPEVGTTAANSGYLCNTPVTLTATPAQGYTFTGWSVNGQIVSADAEYDIIATQNSTLVATFIMDVPVCEEWQLVTSANDLQNGDQIIIAASDLNKAMGEQKTNNRGVADINKNATGNTLELPISDDVQVLTANFVATNNTWTLNTGNGYLYAAGASNNNHLKTENAVDNNGNANWSITISNNVASIVAQGTATRNTMLYNQNTNNPIISCYSSSTSGNAYHTLAIYRLADMKAQSDTTAVVLAESFEWRGTTYPASGDYEVLVGTAANGCDSVRVLHLTLQQKVATPTFTPAAGNYAEPQTLTIACATEGATIYYTMDGTEPTPNSTQYTAAITLNADTTVKAIAVKDGDEWVNSDVATAAYTFDFPSYTVTFNPGDNGTVPQATMSGNQYTEPVDFANNVPSPAATCTDWTFAGWSTTAVMGNTTTEPTFVTSPYYPTGDIMLYAVYQKTEQGSSAATWIKATSIDVGDVVVLVNENAKVELSGVTTYGTTSSYSSSPIGTYPLTVVQGSGTGYYSLKTSDNTDTYLSWTSGNALATSNTVNSSSSWDISINSNGNAVISNVGTTSRKLQYNSGSPRFACYTSSQATVQFYKMMSTSTTTYNSNPVCSYMVYVDGNMQNGTVIIDPATATTDGALIGSTVTLTATPNQGYHFGYWQVSTDATYTNPVTVTNNSFEMPTSDVYVNAIFWIDTLHITATVNPAQTGSVDPSEAYVIYGDQVTLTATPAQDYLFENWTSNGQPVGTDAVITITATQDSALVANFVQMEQVVTPIFTSNPEGNTFTTEDVVTVTITTTTPNATIYYTMDGTDPVVPAGRNVTGTQVYEGPITLTETTTLKAVAAAENMINSEIATATYTINQMYYVDVDNSIEHGTVTADPEKGIENTQISLTAVPEEGYIFKAWNVYNANDADQTVTVTNNQFNMPAYDVMVSATFVPDTFTVTFVLNGAQFVAGYTPISRYWYKQQDANLPTTADMEYEGHSFDGWYENANFDGNSWTSVPDTAKSNKTYYAKWNVNNYGLTINYVDFNGQTVHESYSQSLDYGTGYAVASPAVDTYMPELDTVKGTMGTEAVTVNVRYAQVQMLNIDNVTVCTGETTQEINYELIPFFMEYFSGMRQGFETVIDGPMSITAGSNGIAAFTAVNDGTEPLTNTITVTPHDTLGGHTVKGVPQTFTITVNPKNVSEFSEIACDSYTWTAADTTIVDEGENDYVHVFQNQYGCDSTVTLHLNLHKTPTVVVAVDKTYYCTTENVTLNSTGSSTGSEYTYAWTGPNNYESTETNPVLASPLTGEMSGTYQLTVTHTATGCVSEPASVEVVVNTPGTPGYLFTITTNGDAYANIDGSLDEVTPVFATPEVNHFLDGANVNYTVVNNAENSYNAVGDYTITWTATDECGNEATTTQVLHVTQNVCPVATDADNNTYPSVQLAGKCWMAKNLRTTRFSDGRAVNNLMVYDNIMYPNTTENLSRYGYLYDWDNAMDAQNGTVTLDANNHVQGICPTGWRIPNHNDFMDIAGSNSATDMYDLRYNQYWLDGGGNNSTNYSLLPGGCYNDNTGRYENLLGNAYLWGVNPASPSQPRAYWADCKCYMWQVSDTTNGMGHSVRCIKD